MMMLALTILAAMAPVFLMMWFDDIEARHEREHENNRNRRPNHDRPRPRTARNPRTR